jgi:hypothetical protein
MNATALNLAFVLNPDCPILKQNILCSIDPLLSRDLETSNMYSRCYAMGEYTTTISEQRLGKHVLAETNTHAKIEERCFRCGPRRGFIKKTIVAVQLSSAREAEKR